MPNYSRKARPIARRRAREVAEANMHLPIEEARENVLAEANKIGYRVARQTCPPSERHGTVDGNDGYTVMYTRSEARGQALRTLYAATQPAVEDAPIKTRERQMAGLRRMFDDSAPDDITNAEYIRREGIRKTAFYLPVWSYTGLAMVMRQPFVEAQPAVTRFGPNAKRLPTGENVPQGERAYRLGYMTRSAGGGTHFKGLLKGTMRLSQARKFVRASGDDALKSGETVVRGWTRLLDHLDEAS